MSWRALLLLLALSCAGPELAAQGSAPAQVVAGFLALDASGARLHSSATDPIWGLTVRDGEPLGEPIVLIRNCRVFSTTRRRQTTVARVRCSVAGTVVDDGTTVRYLPRHQTTDTAFTLINQDGAWKIRLHALQFSPHVTPQAYLQHLDALLRLFNEEKDKGDPRFQSLLHLRQNPIFQAANR